MEAQLASEKKQQTQKTVWPIAIVWTLTFITLLAHSGIEILSSAGYLAINDQVLLGGKLVWFTFIFLLVFSVGFSVILLYGSIQTMAGNMQDMVQNSRSMLSNQTHSEAVLTQVNENLLLSDAVKSIAFREKDRTVLEDAIRQDIQLGKWQSAEFLINHLDRRFGCRQEAQHLRAELQKFRNATIQEKINSAIKRVESLWSIHDFAEAQKQIDLLISAYPANESIKGLRGETQAKLEQHKKDLLSRWDESVKNNQIDESVKLLELLDNYLTSTEAAALEESARGVFRAKLHNLGVQFSMAVSEKQWMKALKTGRTIVNEFPNSRMAQEVRDKLDILEERVNTS